MSDLRTHRRPWDIPRPPHPKKMATCENCGKIFLSEIWPRVLCERCLDEEVEAHKPKPEPAPVPVPYSGACGFCGRLNLAPDLPPFCPTCHRDAVGNYDPAWNETGADVCGACGAIDCDAGHYDPCNSSRY